MATSAVEDDSMARRSVVVDEEAFEEQFLRCNICHEKFNENERLPKSLPCNHTFCQPCLQRVFDMHEQTGRRGLLWHDEDREGVLKCPSCRVEIYISRSEINALPSDHRVIQMIDFLSKAVSKASNNCPKHENQPLNFFCKRCLVPVCRDCTVLDHKENQGHDIVDVSKTLDEFNAEFDNIEIKGRETMGHLKEKSDSLANASKRLDLLERQLRSKIKDTFIEYRLLLERRQDAMISDMKEMIQAQKSKINAAFVKICENGNDMQKKLDTFTQARSTNDVKQLFELHQNIKETELESEETVQGINEEEMFVGFDFDVKTEGQFLVDMSGLGELSSHQDLGLKAPLPAHQLVILETPEQPPYNPDPDDVVLHCDDSDDTAEEMLGVIDSDRLRERAAVIATAERLAQRAAAAVVQAQQATNSARSRSSSSRRPRRSESYRVVRHPTSSRPAEYSSTRYSTDRDMDET
ncbi:tripartite motif containing 13-like [Liolophura sinensis]|uniref:tripartite motif containing 13-like n=1 Tax=Liolophura sinensis TaxID=3198878 RepID=UPI0031584886